MPGELDTFLQRFLPAILFLLWALAMGIAFWFMPRKKIGKFKPSQETYDHLHK